MRNQVERCLLHFDGRRYDIDAFVLMPNHVHAVIKPACAHDLSTVLQGIKGVSAHRCNKLLGLKTTFWMDESYDHIVRDAKELTVFRSYIARNPVKDALKPEEYSLQLRNVLMPCKTALAASIVADKIVCVTSNIQKHSRLPTAVRLLDDEIMKRHCFHIRALMMPFRIERFALSRCLYEIHFISVVDLHFSYPQQQTLGVLQKNQLLQEIE